MLNNVTNGLHLPPDGLDGAICPIGEANCPATLYIELSSGTRERERDGAREQHQRSTE